MTTLPNPRGTKRDLEFTSQGDESSYAPEILTRSTELAQLLALDAGDVVECYALTRMAKLENSGMSGKTTLTVRKSAIGFRYKPKSSSPDAVTKEPFALTLEYGPQRTGSTQSFEAMPSVNGHKRELEKEGEEGMYLSWENHGKRACIYFSWSFFTSSRVILTIYFVTSFFHSSQNLLRTANRRRRMGQCILYGAYHWCGTFKYHARLYF